MEDARVWTMTVAAVGAALLVCLVCGGFLLFGLGARSMSAPVPMPPMAAATAVAIPAPSSDAAVLLREAVLRPETETASEPTAVLPACAVVTVLQRSERRYTCRDPDCFDVRHAPLEFDPVGEGYFWYQIQTAGGAVGWIFGRDLAIRSDSSFVSGLPDLGWGGRGVLHEDLDMDGTAEQLWFAVTDVGYEWPGGTLDPTPGGRLVVEDPDTGLAATHAVAGILIGNYGDRVGEVLFRDPNGDGRTEIMLRVDVSVSEVGYGGHEFLILRYRDGILEPVFEHAAAISLIAGVGEYRWDRLEVGSGEITLDAVDLEVYSACRAWTIDEPDTASDRCLRGEHRVWRWDTTADRFVVQTESDALQVRATVGPVELARRGEPDAHAPSIGTFPAGAEVRVQRIRDWHDPTEVDGVATFWVLAIAPDGTAGWVPAAQLRFADGMLQPYMRGDLTAEGQVTPVVW